MLHKLCSYGFKSLSICNTFLNTEIFKVQIYENAATFLKLFRK